MLVPRGRFYRRQKRARGPARLRFFARCGPRRQGGPVCPVTAPARACPSAALRTYAHQNAHLRPPAGCSAGCACGGGVARCGRCRAVASRAAAPNRTSYYRYPAAGEPNTYESIGVHGGPYIHALQQDPERERERERRERERESLMQQGMVMHVTVLRLTCNGLRSRAGASCELGAPSQRRTLSSACSARRTWSTQSVSGLGRVLRSDPRTSRTYCGAT